MSEIMINIFEQNKTIAVIGMSKSVYKAAFSVPMFMLNQSYTIIPINPTTNSIQQMKCYSTLDDVTENIDILNVFRPNEEVFAIVQNAVERKITKGDIKVIWLQEGIYDNNAKKLAEDNGIIFIQNKCMYKEYVKLF